jgi:iron complex outermembrane receptor protein
LYATIDRKKKAMAYSTDLYPRRTTWLATTAVLVFFSTAGERALADAIEQGDAQLEEVLVTAEKRSTNLQQTPVAVTALNGQDLANRLVHDLSDIQGMVPNFSMGESIGVAQIAIRGIGTTAIVPGAEGAVAVNINEVYVSRPVAQLAGIFDVADIEVLRGPQGTLYGRNATAGSVNITTVMPTRDLSGEARTTVGNYHTTNFEGALSGPVVGDVLTARLAVATNYHDGYGTNEVTGDDIDNQKNIAVRLTLLAKLRDGVTDTLIAEHYEESDNSGALHYSGAAGLLPVPGTLGTLPYTLRYGGYVASGERDIASEINPFFRLNTTSVINTLDAKLWNIDIKSISGYRNQTSRGLVDLSGGSLLAGYYLYGEPAHQFSEDLLINYDSGPFHATAGAYYFDEYDRTNPGHAPFTAIALARFIGAPTPADPNELISFFQATGLLTTKAYAAFGQATYLLTDKLSLVAGLRYSHEKKEISDHYYGLDFVTPFSLDIPRPTTANSASYHNVSPKFGINYQLEPKTFLYATYSQGFKSGGFDISGTGTAYQPEKLTDYEVGMKTELVDNRVTLNLSGFYYDYSNLQVQQQINSALVTTNAATATIYGLESEVTALLTPSIVVEGSVSYLHARFGRYLGPDPAQPLLTTPVDYSGKTLPRAPDWRVHLGIEKRFRLEGGTIKLRGEGDYTSRDYFTSANFTQLSQAGYVKFNAFLTYEMVVGWHVGAFVRNIANKTTVSSMFVADDVTGDPLLSGFAPPRTYGCEFGYRF